MLSSRCGSDSVFTTRRYTNPRLPLPLPFLKPFFTIFTSFTIVYLYCMVAVCQPLIKLMID